MLFNSWKGVLVWVISIILYFAREKLLGVNNIPSLWDLQNPVFLCSLSVDGGHLVCRGVLNSTQGTHEVHSTCTKKLEFVGGAYHYRVKINFKGDGWESDF